MRESGYSHTVSSDDDLLPREPEHRVIYRISLNGTEQDNGRVGVAGQDEEGEGVRVRLARVLGDSERV